MVGMSKGSNKAPTEIGGAGSSKRLCREYGGSLRRVRCQADGLAYASTMGRMQVEPQQRNAHPTEDQSGSMNPRDFSRGENQVWVSRSLCCFVYVTGRRLSCTSFSNATYPQGKYPLNHLMERVAGKYSETPPHA